MAHNLVSTKTTPLAYLKWTFVTEYTCFVSVSCRIHLAVLEELVTDRRTGDQWRGCRQPEELTEAIVWHFGTFLKAADVSIYASIMTDQINWVELKCSFVFCLFALLPNVITVGKIWNYSEKTIFLNIAKPQSGAPFKKQSITLIFFF